MCMYSVQFTIRLGSPSYHSEMRGFMVFGSGVQSVGIVVHNHA